MFISNQYIIYDEKKHIISREKLQLFDIYFKFVLRFNIDPLNNFLIGLIMININNSITYPLKLFQTCPLPIY